MSSDNMDTQMSNRGPSFSKPKLSLMMQETTTSGGGDIDMFQSTNGSGMIQIGSADNEIDLNASYQVSANDTLRAGGFVIKPSGIASQPPLRSGGAASSASSSRSSLSSFSSSSFVPSPGYSSLGASFTTQDGELSFSPKDLVELGSVGKGACGVVKRAMHVPSLHVVALKSINIFDRDKRHQFVKELTALGAVHSPYIVGFFGATYAEGSINILLEYANRHSLLEMLKTHGPFEERMLKRIALHTFRGLQLLHHAHCIHRDIKPGNILINSNAECKLTDFGVVTALEGTMDLASTFVGTTIFMAPERVTQEGKYSYPSDIWGIVKSIRDDPVPPLPAVHPVTGRPYSDEFRELVSLCLQKEATMRPTATKILEHAFFRDADQQWQAALDANKGVLHTLMQPTEADWSDLDAVLLTLYRAHYENGKGEYRKSLMEMARFQKLQENLNNAHIQVKQIQGRFEEIYTKMREQEKK